MKQELIVNDDTRVSIEVVRNTYKDDKFRTHHFDHLEISFSQRCDTSISTIVKINLVTPVDLKNLGEAFIKLANAIECNK